MTVRRAHPLQSEEQWVPGSRARGGPVALPVAMGQGGGAREGAYSLEYVDRLSGEPARLPTCLRGWLLDVYADRAGMAVWLLEEDGRRLRLLDPFRPTFYLAGPRHALDAALRALPRRGCPLTTSRVERRELGSPDPIPVLEVAVHQPSQFLTLTRWLIQQCDQAQFYHVDVPLPQRYFYERGLFPLARCEAELAGDGTIRSIHAVDSPWDTGYAIPPLSILELSLEGHASNPNHGGAFHLVVRVEGEERCLEGDDGAELLARLNQLLHRHDPDVILTDWGDSYILPRLLMLASRLRLPLALNRDAERPVGMHAHRSYFSYGRLLANAGAGTLYGAAPAD